MEGRVEFSPPAVHCPARCAKRGRQVSCSGRSIQREAQFAAQISSLSEKTNAEGINVTAPVMPPSRIDTGERCLEKTLRARKMRLVLLPFGAEVTRGQHCFLPASLI